jgi:hypothetical protein
LEVATGEFILYGVHAVYETYLRGILSPFLLKVDGNEKVPDFIARLKTVLAMEDAEFKRLRFMLGTLYAQYSANAILKGDKTMGETITAVSATANVYLFVLHPASKKAAVGASRDVSLRIYN